MSKARAASSLLIDSLFKQPKWSTKSLLPPTNPAERETISSKQLDHLIKLSALPQPRDAKSRQAMLRNLSDQMHFVKQVQEVDTTGIEPLTNITAEQPAQELTYEDAQIEPDVISSDLDYTGMASKVRGDYYTVSGGLRRESDGKDG